MAFFLSLYISSPCGGVRYGPPFMNWPSVSRSISSELSDSSLKVTLPSSRIRLTFLTAVAITFSMDSYSVFLPCFSLEYLEASRRKSSSNIFSSVSLLGSYLRQSFISFNGTTDSFRPHSFLKVSQILGFRFSPNFFAASPFLISLQALISPLPSPLVAHSFKCLLQNHA